MAPFDKENYMHNVFREFRNIEQFHNNFRIKFTSSINDIVSKYHNDVIDNTKLKTVIYAYAGHLIDVIESIIEKDKNYSEYRLMIELHRMKKVNEKISQPKSDYCFSSAIERKVKSMVVNNFPSIINFTANGFRLLEINLKVFTRDFLTDFYFDLKNTDAYQA